MKLTLESVLRKVANPPAPQNWVRLIVPGDLTHTAKKIANFALGVPEFNYVVGAKMCHDRVRNNLDLATAIKACERYGAPAGREQNADFVRAFYAFDERRRYSACRYFDSYNGFFPMSREVKIPTKPTFTIIEDKKQVPVVLCGWKTVPLDFGQRKIVSTVYESGLFSYGAYRHSPGEIVFFPECETENGSERVPEVWRRGEFGLLSNAEVRDLLEFYALAQEAALPLIRDRWAEKEQRRRERGEGEQPDENRPSLQIELFEPR
jgi:hypothetical protein